MRSFFRPTLSMLIVVAVAAGCHTYGAVVGPETAVVNALVMTNNGDTLYAATASAGVWKRSLSPPGTWAPVNSGLVDLFVRDLAMDKNNNFVLYAATLGGLFKTTDGAATWTRLTYDRTEALAIDPGNSNNIYVGTNGGGVRRSTNAGATFTSSMAGLTDRHVQAVAVNPVSANIILAGTERAGIFKSIDSGASWSAKNSGITDPIPGGANENFNIAKIAFQPGNNNVWVGAFHPAIVGDVFKSIDGGENWVKQNLGYNIEGASSFGFFSQSLLYIGTRNGMVASTDGGATFQPAWSFGNGTFVHIHSIAVAPASVDAAGRTVYIGPIGLGVLKSTNAGIAAETWTGFNTGLQANRVNALQFKGGTFYAGVQEGGVFTSPNATTWTGGYNPTGSGTAANGLEFQANRGTFTILSLAVAPSNPSIVYAGAKRIGIWKSTNSGTNWSRLSAGTVPNETNIDAIAVSPSDPNVVYAGSFQLGILKSTDGSTFSVVRSGLPAKSIAINPVSPSQVLVGTYDTGVFKSTDAGATWAAQSVTHQGVDRMTFSSIAFDPFGGGNGVMAGTNKGLFVSTNGGNSWVLKTNAIPDNWVNRVLFDPATANKIYAGTYQSGVFVSTDGGTTWSQATGLGGLTVLDMTLNGAGILFVATPTGVLQ